MVDVLGPAQIDGTKPIFDWTKAIQSRDRKLKTGCGNRINSKSTKMTALSKSLGKVSDEMAASIKNTKVNIITRNNEYVRNQTNVE